MTLISTPESARSAFDRVWDALDVNGYKPESRRGDQFMALCPVHGDSHRSLSVKNDRANEKVLLNCFTCHADVREITAAIGLGVKDLFDSPLPERTEGQPRRKPKVRFTAAPKLPPRLTNKSTANVDKFKGAKWERVTTYPYFNAEGTLVEEVIRETATVDGETRKRFKQRFLGPNGRMVAKKPDDFVSVLYRHPEVLQAIEAGTRVWLLEGEKDVENAEAAGLVATTNAQGSGSFPRELAEIFQGADVAVVADRDVAGYSRAAELHKLLGGVGATVTLYRPAVDDDKADLTDHLEAGYTVDQLEQLTPNAAQLLAMLGELRKMLTGEGRSDTVQVCRDEIDAQLASGADSHEVQRNVELWAGESVRRVAKMRDHLEHTVAMVPASTPLERAAVHDARHVIQDAVVIARDAHEIADLPIPDALAAPVTPLQPGGSGSGDDSEPPRFDGNQFFPGDDGSANEGTRFGVRLGQTVQIKVERDGDDFRNRYIRVFDGWGEVLAASYEDSGHETHSTPPTTEITVAFHRWVRDPETGKPMRDDNGDILIEDATVVWDDEQIRDGSWANSLPWLGMLESTSRRGKDLFWDALYGARPTPSQRSKVYTGTGWREDSAFGPYFVHAGGAITAEGSIPVSTRLTGGLQRLHLPDPTADAQLLREAWLESTEIFRGRIPARVIAPLLGLVWQAPFSPVPLITYVYGPPGAGKSSSARCAMHFLAPELTQENSEAPKTILSATSAGDSAIAMTRILANARHMAVLADDFVDTDIRKAVARFEFLVRAVFDREGRKVGGQRGGVKEAPAIDASVIATGQIGLNGSALQRTFSIGLNPGEIEEPDLTFGLLEQSGRRNSRALLGASLIRWLAKHREALREHYFSGSEDAIHTKAQLAKLWRERTAPLPHDPGAKGRMKDAAVNADHGIRLMLRMLVEVGAISTEEATDFHKWADQGIWDALVRQEGGQSNPGVMAIELLREALASGAAHLVTTTGEIPEEAEQLGWTRRGIPPQDTWSPNGVRVGAIKYNRDGESRLYLHPKVMIDVITRIAAGTGEPITDSVHSIGGSFIAHGWTKADGEGNQTLGRRVEGRFTRVWDIPLSVLLGDDGDCEDDDETGDHTPQTPIGGPSATLFDVPPTRPAPPSPPAAEQPAPAPEGAPAAEAPTTAAPAAQKPAARRAAAGEFAAAAAVLDTDGLWLPDGTLVPLERPIEHLGNIAELVAQLRLGTKNQWKNEAGQIYATADAARALGIPVDELPSPERRLGSILHDLTVDHPLVLGAREAGYEVGGQDNALSATTRIWKPGESRLQARFVIIPALRDDFQHLIGDNPAPAVLAHRLDLFASALQTPYAVNASTTGQDLMFHLAPSKEERIARFTPHKPVEPATIPTLEMDINWHRQPTEEELQHRWLHAYDRGGSYLAGVSGCELGIGEPSYHPNGVAFDRKLPGYWKVNLPERAEWLVPNPLDPINRDKSLAGLESWVSTPTLELAIEWGYEFEILEAWTWENHTRLLDTWYERIRNARTELDTADPDAQAARDLLKEVYVRSLGLMASFEHHEGKPGFAPERYHAIQARARANILRRVKKIGDETGRWPVAITRDTVLYTSPLTDPDKAWPGDERNYGRGLGQFKYEGSADLQEHLPFLTGKGRYEGKSHLIELI
ncbi:telomere-associated protein [Microbacterium sp. LB12]|uniref:telomere-associated protein n=1 Tax=Microbacterium sp. LB12 TaxID=3081270 RepID=UPI00301642D5